MAESPTFVEVSEAQGIVLDCVRALGQRAEVAVDLDDALGLTLAEDICCDVDVPAFDRSMMDGYALRAADVAGPGTRLSVSGSIAAGADSLPALPAGCAVQVNTGAPVPASADAVVRVEDTRLSGNGQTVEVTAACRAEQHICRRGTYASAGKQVLRRGTRLGPLQIAAAATAGAARVRVVPLPRAAVLVTGDEIVDAADRPSGFQTRNSNGPALLALLRDDGLQPRSLGIARDDKEVLAGQIRLGLQSDCLCITGGISMGAFDFVPEALERCGVTFHFRKVAAKPGKPTIFGTSESGCCVFGLPGNPVSALIGYWLFVRPALKAMQGWSGDLPRHLQAVLDGEAKSTDNRQSFWPARLISEYGGRLLATPLPWSGSGDSIGMADANGLIVRRPGSGAAGRGEPVEVILLERPCDFACHEWETGSRPQQVGA